MVQYLRRTNPYYSSIGTTRTILLNESSATQVFLSTGYTAMYVTNLSVSDVVWGDSSILVGSAGMLVYSQAKQFENLRDNFSFYWRSNSASAVIGINEFIN